ncbi:MAG: Maf-like protein [Prevotellaceae bacterium]|nr:Maf-like protein [Prevotellaceae bacterium]
MNNYKIILASNSPRRKELLAGLDLDFTVKVLPGIDESYPDDMPKTEVAQYISVKKAEPYKALIADDELVITADTVVICDNQVLGKPKDAEDAHAMLSMLSGRTHQVVTGVCLTTTKEQRQFSVVTNVTFDELTPQEIDYYIEHYRPYDKAGAYGIQEWIGYVGVTRLEGSYFNVMGFPVQRIYKEINKLLC